MGTIHDVQTPQQQKKKHLIVDCFSSCGTPVTRRRMHSGHRALQMHEPCVTHTSSLDVYCQNIAAVAAEAENFPQTEIE